MSLASVDKIEAQIASAEARFDNIRPDNQKQIVWAGKPGVQTDIAVLYVHGFSAAPPETRPVADNFAAALGANLYFTRLTGHGQDGASMARARAEDWYADIADAFDVGQILGKQLIVICCSYGSPLSIIELANRAADKMPIGIIFIAPCFQVKSKLARFIMALPGVGWWGPYVFRGERAFPPKNERHAQNWTTTYPASTMFASRAGLRRAAQVDVSKFDIPALTVMSPDDDVVCVHAARQRATDWGGQSDIEPIHPGPTDDPGKHVIAGDILSPGQTGIAVDKMLNWAELHLGLKRKS